MSKELDGIFHLNKYRRCLKERLTPERYHHSICVMNRAAQLASLHGVDWYRASVAGLLHDICQCEPKGVQLKYLQSHDILLDSFALANPPIWHAICGSIYLREKLGITDEAVLSAVRYHTTGRAFMAKLEQVVYLADATSADRGYPGVTELRDVADRSLEQAMFQSLQHTIETLAKNGQPMILDTWEAYHYHWNQINSISSAIDGTEVNI